MDAYLAFRTLGVIAPRVPVSIGYAVIRGLVSVLSRRESSIVRGLRANLRHALGPSASPAQLDETVRRAFCGVLQNYYDMFRLPALTTKQLAKVVSVVGWENIQAARALGQGLVLLTGHLGSPEAGMQIISSRDLPVMGPAEHVQPERLYRYLVRLRTRHGLQLIPSDGPLFELFRALRRNEAVGLALDRDTTNSGVLVTLCGEPARLPDGYAHLAAKLRVPLVPAICYRLPDGRAQLGVEPMLVFDDVADRQSAYHAALDFGVRTLERAITAYPDQWVMTTPIWVSDD
jgi:lauroyl/myristoyl acyltransferase